LQNIFYKNYSYINLLGFLGNQNNKLRGNLNVNFKDLYKIYKNSNYNTLPEFFIFIKIFTKINSNFLMQVISRDGILENKLIKLFSNIIIMGDQKYFKNIFKISEKINFFEFTSNSKVKFKETKLSYKSNTYYTTLFNKYRGSLDSGKLRSDVNHGNVFYYFWVIGAYKTFFETKYSFFRKNLVKFMNTNIVKFVDLTTLNTYDIFFLRRSKIFNKGRYSRNRQFYRTGVY